MKVQVLISCMFDSDHSVIKHTNLQSDAIVVNQCDNDSREIFNITSKSGKECCITYINTTERGLSRSRNMAIKNSDSDICLLCDDDEELVDNYDEIIVNAFEENPSADIIAFNIKRPSKTPFSSTHKLRYIEALKVSSVHIAFRRERIIANNIVFDVMLGSGSGNGGGEDTKFMRDCWKKGLSQWGNSSFIGVLKDTSKSLWFHGFNKQFFLDYGWTSRRVFGSITSVFTLLIYTVKHYKDYRKDISFYDALRYSFVGWGMKK